MDIREDLIITNSDPSNPNSVTQAVDATGGGKKLFTLKATP